MFLISLFLIKKKGQCSLYMKMENNPRMYKARVRWRWESDNVKTPETICADRRHIKASGGHVKFPVTKMPGLFVIFRFFLQKHNLA